MRRGIIADVLQNMVRSGNPLARAAAAFAIGHIMADNCTSTLEGLLRDGDAGVRGEALRSLIRIRRQDRKEAAPEAGTPAAETPATEGAAIPDANVPTPANAAELAPDT